MSDEVWAIILVIACFLLCAWLTFRRWRRWMMANDYPNLEWENNSLRKRLNEYDAERNKQLISKIYAKTSPDSLEAKLRAAEERAAAAEKRAEIAEEKLAALQAELEQQGNG